MFSPTVRRPVSITPTLSLRWAIFGVEMGLICRRLCIQEIMGTGRVRSSRLIDSDPISLFKVRRLPDSSCQGYPGERVRRLSSDPLLIDMMLILLPRGRMMSNIKLLIWNEPDLTNVIWGRSMPNVFFHRTFHSSFLGIQLIAIPLSLIHI